MQSSRCINMNSEAMKNRTHEWNWAISSIETSKKWRTIHPAFPGAGRRRCVPRPLDAPGEHPGGDPAEGKIWLQRVRFHDD